MVWYSALLLPERACQQGEPCENAGSDLAGLGRDRKFCVLDNPGPLVQGPHFEWPEPACLKPAGSRSFVPPPRRNPRFSLLLVTAGKAHRSQACLKTVRSRQRLSLSAASKTCPGGQEGLSGSGAGRGRTGRKGKREIAHHPSSRPSPREPAAGGLAGRWAD